ncbi:hypothetical protein DPMN_053152 [Dreissena polymorpha]|uniref:Uncharacterized protein n=1 Tax=Dreissena polymorpha TaxID=45954 RepID=A0A9D4CMS2_DREPO|nr:hypothetical protein DPMN_053152 [Dreissena polymorpha]
MPRSLAAIFFDEPFLLNRAMRTNVLTNFHKDWTIDVPSCEKNSPPSFIHAFQQTGAIFEPIQYIIRTYVLTNFNEDCTINVTFTGLTRFYSSFLKIRQYVTFRPCKEKLPTPGGHVFKQQEPFSKMSIKDIIGTNLLQTFQVNRTINVASRVITKQMMKTHDRQRTTEKPIKKAHHEHA